MIALDALGLTVEQTETGWIVDAGGGEVVYRLPLTRRQAENLAVDCIHYLAQDNVLPGKGDTYGLILDALLSKEPDELEKIERICKKFYE